MPNPFRLERALAFERVEGEPTIVYASCTQNGYEVLRHLLRKGVPIAEILTLSPRLARENAVSGYAPFEEIADVNDISTFVPGDYSMETDRDLKHFDDLEATLLIVNGWQRLIPAEILNTFEIGAIGVHGSAYGLPQGRGRSPLNWSVIEDLNRFLHSIIMLSGEADAGAVVGTRKFEITPHDDIRTLYYKNVIATQEILEETLEGILTGTVDFEPQTGVATFYPKRNPEDGAIHWAEKTEDIYNLVRALTRPYPGAYTEHDGDQVNIWRAIPFSDDFIFDAQPGEIVQVFEYTQEFVVKTADGTLLVREWEAEGFTPERGVTFTSIGTPDRVDRPKERRR